MRRRFRYVLVALALVLVTAVAAGAIGPIYDPYGQPISQF